MDAQLKKGLLEICVLKSIESADSYGYLIIKDLEKYIAISESTLYPILRRLENNKELSSYSINYNNRIRKYYHITSLGIMKLENFRKDMSELENIFSFINQ